jgi:hypothetical protein
MTILLRFTGRPINTASGTLLAPEWCVQFVILIASHPARKKRASVGVRKETRAIIEDKESELDTHNRAVESHTAAVEELNEMGVHVNNAGEFPVFTPGVK